MLVVVHLAISKIVDSKLFFKNVNDKISSKKLFFFGFRWCQCCGSYKRCRALGMQNIYDQDSCVGTFYYHYLNFWRKQKKTKKILTANDGFCSSTCLKTTGEPDDRYCYDVVCNSDVMCVCVCVCVLNGVVFGCYIDVDNGADDATAHAGQHPRRQQLQRRRQYLHGGSECRVVAIWQ